MTLSLDETVSAEKRLLLCCARTEMPPSKVRSMWALLANPIDWDVLIDGAVRHCVTPLLALNLFALAPDAIPTEHRARLKNLVQANSARCLLLSAELTKLDAQFRSQGLLPMPYKGPVLAAQAYRNIALRQFDDLDIVFRQLDMPMAHGVMLDLGYQAKFPPLLSPSLSPPVIPGEYKYYDSAREIIVELHTEFTLRHFPKLPNLDDFASRLVPISLGGAHDIHTFAPEDALSLLCIHGSKDFWDRLSWIVDIAELIHSHPRLDWDQVFQRAESLQAQRMLNLGLLLALRLIDSPLPDQVVSRLQRDKVATAVASEIERRLLDRDDLTLRSAAARFNFRRRMISGTIAAWKYALRLAVAPADEDLQSASLPSRLAPLQVFLRPLRLLRKYGWSGRRAQHPNP